MLTNYTVIIPHYNSFDKIYRLIDSIPSRKDIQVIVIDDKSDNIEEIDKLASYCRNREVLFIQNNTEKKGAGVCRNIGLDKVTGKWLMFADADDYFLENAFEVVDRFKDSDYDIVYFTPTSINLNTGKVSDRHLYFKKLIDEFNAYNTKIKYNHLKYHSVILWSRMINYSIVKDNSIRFDETVVANDVNFSTKVAYYAKKIIALKDEIYCVTKSENTLTTKKDFNNLIVRVNVFLDQFNFLKERLDYNEFTELDLGGRTFIISALKDYGIIKCLKIVSVLMQNKVPVIGKSVFKRK